MRSLGIGLGAAGFLQTNAFSGNDSLSSPGFSGKISEHLNVKNIPWASSSNKILPEGRRIVDQNHLKSIWQQQLTLWSRDDRSRIWLELYTSHFFPKFGQARLRSGDSKHVQKLHQGAVKKAEAVKGKRQKYKSAARPQSVALITDSGVKAVNQLPTKSMCKHLKGSLTKQLRIHLLPVILDIISIAYVYYCTVIRSNYLDHQNVHKLVNSWFRFQLAPLTGRTWDHTSPFFAEE